MKQVQILLLLLLVASGARAIGSIYVLEIEYRYIGETEKNFIVADRWDLDFKSYVGKDSLFQSEFMKRFGKQRKITVYSRIIDREKMARHANFKMHPFSLDRSSKKEISTKSISKVSLKKIWEKDDYGIQVLTSLTEKDISWISGSMETVYPLGDELGCRLEVHRFKKDVDAKALLEKLAMLYRIEKRSAEESKKMATIIRKLKTMRIVVVEMCGC